MKKYLSLLFTALLSFNVWAVTTFVNIDSTDWVEVSASGSTGFITNTGSNEASYVEAATKPASTEKRGHRLAPHGRAEYDISAGNKIFIRTVRGKAAIAVTPGLTFGGAGSGSTGGNDADGVTSVSSGVLDTNGFNYGFNGTTFDRLRSNGNDTDNVATSSLGILGVSAFGMVFDGSGWDRLRNASPNTDGNALQTITTLGVTSADHIFNGTNFDRERGNTEETLLASAARTTTTNSVDFTNYNAKGIKVVIDVSAIAATPSITVTVEGKDSVSGSYYTLGLTSAAITTVSTNVIEVFPGISETANVSLSRTLPRTYRVTVTHGDGDSITYSVSGALVI